jgi:hypothetical protein
MFEEDVTGLCGAEGRHNVGRAGYRHGTGAGSVTLGGRRVPVRRPRVRAASISKPAVSRRLVAATETALAELMSRRLDDLRRRRSGPRAGQLLQLRPRLAGATRQGCSRPGLRARAGWGDHRCSGTTAAVKLMSWLFPMW